MQDEITDAVTVAVAPAIDDAERRRAMRKAPESLDVWAAYQRGLWHLSKATPDDNDIAQDLFQQAIDLDPTFAGSYSALALVQLQSAALYQKLDPTEALRSAEGLEPKGRCSRRKRRCAGRPQGEHNRRRMA